MESKTSPSSQPERRELWQGLVLSGGEVTLGGHCLLCTGSHSLPVGKAGRWLVGLIMKAYWGCEGAFELLRTLHDLHVALVRTRQGNTYVCYTGSRQVKVLEAMIDDQGFRLARLSLDTLGSLDPVPTAGGASIGRTELTRTEGANKTLQCAVPQALCFALLQKELPIEVSEVYLRLSRRVLYVNWAIPCTTCQRHVPVLLCRPTPATSPIRTGLVQVEYRVGQIMTYRGKLYRVAAVEEIGVPAIGWLYELVPPQPVPAPTPTVVPATSPIWTGLVQVEHEVGQSIIYRGKRYQVAEVEEVGEPTIGWRYRLTATA